MTQRTTVFCSSCGVENPIVAKFCFACGVVMGSIALDPAGVVPTADVAPRAATVAATPASSPDSPRTLVRECLVGTLVQKVGLVMLSVVAGLTTLAGFFALIGADNAWARRGRGFLIEVARPAPAYLVGALVLVILAPTIVRQVRPRRRDVTLAELRRFGRSLRDESGIRLLLSPSGLRSGLTVIALMWIGVGFIAWHNLTTLGDAGWEIGGSLYIALGLPVTGLVATALIWPFRREIVYMDRRGTITRD